MPSGGPYPIARETKGRRGRAASKAGFVEHEKV